jgi:hypothetical protein
MNRERMRETQRRSKGMNERRTFEIGYVWFPRNGWVGIDITERRHGVGL